ncbi:GPP34 family phosphoprotein [Nonomuraea sp. K274]|uniref:GPP34 family phosphoprotein n=1 Tax=Nonomuraea cypriaca TaxID=1187855 RepID=A0A931F1Q4_9ACTN|nr:GPP34 family phosphoprotein [Nonomuraea cypriaca]MBF8192124.1 GPP34 family phosphoprotein [Nonomuraea cypriaca]
MPLTIAEELLLLVHSNAGKPLVSSLWLDPALAGAILAELAVTGRVELSGRKLTINDPAPLGDAELDATLARIAQKRRSPTWWVQTLQSGKQRRRLLTKLVTAGVLAEERGRALGIFPVTRWPHVYPGVAANVREEVSGVLTGADPDARTATLIAIMHAAGLEQKLFPGATRTRVREIAEADWAPAPVTKTVAGVAAATSAVIAMTGSG